MESKFKRSLIAILVTGSLAAPVASHATNGMFMIGFGSKAESMGGAAIAFPQDSLSGAANPATIGAVGNRFDIGMELFKPKAESTLVGFEQDSTASHYGPWGVFFIPHLGFTVAHNDDVSYGFSFVPAGGGGSRYNKNLYNNAIGGGADVNKPVGVSLDIAQMNPTVSFRFQQKHYFGGTLVLSFQKFRAFGLDYFATFTSTGLTTTTLTDNGNDYAYGAGLRLGYLGKFMDDRLMLGAVATSKVYMTKFDKYSNLFAEQGSMDTPANLGVGLSYKFTPRFTTALDITYTMYEDVAAIGNRGPGVTGTDLYPVSQAVNSLGNDEGLGFGWHNQTVYKLGFAYDLNSAVTLRTGWNYGKSPIPSDNGALLFNIVAPATTQHHFTMGATYRTDPKTEWNFMYMYAFGYYQTGPTYLGQATIGMRQNSLGLTYDLKF